MISNNVWRGLSTARAVVIDDNPKDGAALMEALASRGIGAMYLSGRLERLPEEHSVNGVRLLVLDMNLVDSSADVERVVGHIMAENPGPFVIMAWTDNPNQVPDVLSRLVEQRPDLRPAFVFTVSKTDMRENGAFVPERIMNAIESKLANWSPLEILMEWEQRVHDAATDTIAVLSNEAWAEKGESWDELKAAFTGQDSASVMDQEGVAQDLTAAEIATTLAQDLPAGPMATALAQVGGKWKSKVLATLKHLVLAAGGKQVADGTGAFLALQTAMDGIHLDQLDQLPILDPLPQYAASLVPAVPPVLPTPTEAGPLNRMLLIARVQTGQHRPRPGNVYKLTLDKLDALPMGARVITLEMLVKDILKFSKGTKKVDEDRNAALLKSGQDSCIPILVDCTPACDQAQGKKALRPILGGLLVPHDLLTSVDNTDYLKQAGPILFSQAEDGVDGLYHLVLSTHFPVGATDVELEPLTELFRLRKQLLVDVQAWKSNLINRPGIISVPSSKA